MYLERIGADHLVLLHFEPYKEQGLELARICFASHERYSLYLEDGESEAVPSGKLRWNEELPAVGDWAAVRRADSTLVLIEELLPRRTLFSRRTPGSTQREQIIATNVDLALIVSGLDQDFNLRRLERYLVLVRESKADVLVVLNKADLCLANDERIEQARLLCGDSLVLVLSAEENVDALRPLVRDKTVILLGSSGVGKSTIVNGLLAEVRQITNEVRKADSRGRHTTTNRMLFPLPAGGAIIDNPGMRELQLWASVESLESVFEDIVSLATQCYFADCTHTIEPHCAVQRALESGSLDPARWHGYQKLMAELAYECQRQNVKAIFAPKVHWKSLRRTQGRRRS